jgi:hypothetical protein
MIFLTGTAFLLTALGNVLVVAVLRVVLAFPV